MVQIAAVAVRWIRPEMEALLGPFVPLITVNSAVLGVALLTLVVSLVWTAALAAAVVGHVNVVSVAFAVLVIGVNALLFKLLRKRDKPARAENPPSES